MTEAYIMAAVVIVALWLYIVEHVNAKSKRAEPLYKKRGKQGH